jgi:hypothetical protein
MSDEVELYSTSLPFPTTKVIYKGFIFQTKSFNEPKFQSQANFYGANAVPLQQLVSQNAKAEAASLGANAIIGVKVSVIFIVTKVLLLYNFKFMANLHCIILPMRLILIYS